MQDKVPSMSHKPKSIREIYTDSIAINLESLEKDMRDHGLDDGETSQVLSEISGMYQAGLREIETECGKDAMALESVPSPLELLLKCVAKAQRKSGISTRLASFLGRYSSALSDWNI